MVKVPLLIKYPGNANGGTSSDVLTNLVDVAPTLLGQAGVDTPHPMPGLDLADASAGREIAFLENTPAGYYVARLRTHKLIWDRQPGKSQFFDLQADPLEMRNLIDEPSVQPLVDEYRQAISEWMLFGSTTALRLDESAPQIAQPNVPGRGVPPQVREEIDRLAQPSLVQSE